MNQNLDTAYRILIIEHKRRTTPVWFGSYSSQVGSCGCARSYVEAVDTARANGLKKGTYQVWKFHIGLPDSKIPWFPPKDVTS